MPSREGPLTKEYVHQGMNQEVTAAGGHYVLTKEARLPFEGREVLYLVGHAVVDTACCGPGGFGYAVVPGFVVQWQHETNRSGALVSLVEPVADGASRRTLQLLLERK